MRTGPSPERQKGIRSGQSKDKVCDTVANVAACAGRICVLLTVLAAPWFLGAVQASIQLWILGAVLLALACTTVYLVFRSEQQGPLSIPLAILPLLLAFGLGVVHLTALDRSTLNRLSPKAVATTDEFLPTADSPEQLILTAPQFEPIAERRPMTVCPAATRQSLALLILATSIFFLASVLFCRPATHLWLLGLVAANGAAIGFFGLAQNLTWNGQIYWTIVLTNGGGPFGPFINRNNGGGYLVLCLAASVGLTLWCLGHFFNAWDLTARSHRNPREGIRSRITTRIVSAVAELNAQTLTWLTIAGLLVAAICCTLSRGSVLAMLAAVLVTVAVMIVSQRRGLAILWPVAAMAVGLSLIGWVGLSDEVGARLATLFDDETIQQGRWPHWQDGLKAASDYPRAGSGLGTYRFVYAQYQERLAEVWFRYAENVYLQVLVEGGIIGLALLLSGLSLIGASVWRLLKYGDDLTTLAFAVTGVFALAGQMVASMFDFGLFIPANFLLFALLCGALAGSAARLRSHRTVCGSWRPALNRGATILTASGLIAGCCWSMSEIRTIVPAEKALRDVRLAGELQELSAPLLAHHIEALTGAGQIRPDDTELRRRLAELWLQRYQVETAEELQARTSFKANDPRLIQLASPLLIHQRAWLYERSEMPDEMDALRQSTAVQKNLAPALKHLLASRQACPLLPEVHCGIAQLCALLGPVSQDEIHISRTRRLAPGNPDMLYLSGLLDFQAGRFPEAYAAWKASLSLSPRYLSPVLQIAGAGLAAPDAVEELLPDSPELLVDLAVRQFATAGMEPIREQLLARAEALLPVSNLPAAEQLHLQGSILAIREAYPEAILSYKQAVNLRSYEVDWRYELARLLQKQGFLDEAHEHARRCARLEPREMKHRKLLEEIHHTRLTQTPGARGS